MKSKGSLVLMELLVMILVFALAAALCLRAFAKAREISDRTVRMDEASFLAQNAAEMLKATQGDFRKARGGIKRSIPSGNTALLRGDSRTGASGNSGIF